MLLTEIATQPQFQKPRFETLYDAAQVFDRFRGMPVQDFVTQCRLGKAVYFSQLKDNVIKPTYEDFQASQQQQTAPAARVMPVLVQIGGKVAVMTGGDTLSQCMQNNIDPICWLVRG